MDRFQYNLFSRAVKIRIAVVLKYLFCRQTIYVENEDQPLGIWPNSTTYVSNCINSRKLTLHCRIIAPLIQIFFRTLNIFRFAICSLFAAACIWEATRLGVILPVSLAHTVTNDTQLRGYSVPRDNTCVIANFYASHR